MTKRTSKKLAVEIPTAADILAKAAVNRSIVTFEYRDGGEKENTTRVVVPCSFQEKDGFWNCQSLYRKALDGKIIEQGSGRLYDPLKMVNVRDFDIATATEEERQTLVRMWSKLAPLFKALDRAKETSAAKREREEKERNERMQAAFAARKALKQAEKPAF